MAAPTITSVLRGPLDGQGLRAVLDPDLAALRHWAASTRWRRLPPGLRMPARATARLAWLAGAVGPCLRFSRRFDLSRSQALRLLADCWASGAQPNEAFVWRRVLAPSCHPLPGRAAGLVLGGLGDPAAHRLLADKLAAAQWLAAAGIAVVATRARLVPGRSASPDAAAWARPGAWIAKPRHGSASRGVRDVDVFEDGSITLDGRRLADAEDLMRHLAPGPQGDEMLIQDRLPPALELADLAAGRRAPVLRLVTAREPGGPAFLHSALLEIDVPGERPRHFIRGRVRVPVDPASGRLCAGLWFLHPDRRLDTLPWNGAVLAGRPVPAFSVAVGQALRAMERLSGLPLVHWDMIVTGSGPVVLEGNSAGEWILANLFRAAGLTAPPLAPLLLRWLPVRGTDASSPS